MLTVHPVLGRFGVRRLYPLLVLQKTVSIATALLVGILVGSYDPAVAAPSGGGGKSASPAASAAPSSSGASSSAGAWFVLDDHNVELQPPSEAEKKTGLVILCYELQSTNSSTQPLIATPRYSTQSPLPDYQDCAMIDEAHPLQMRQYLVFKIIAKQLPDPKQAKLLNVSVTSAAGTPINPTPMRASISQPSAFTASQVKGLDATYSLDGIYYARWPYPLSPDTDVTVALNVVYPMPQVGSNWAADTFYPAGSVVSFSNSNARGHYFTALKSGKSGGTEPPIPSLEITDGSVTWVDLGTSTAVKSSDIWEGGKAYKSGVVALTPWNGHYLLATKAGTTGANPPITTAVTVADHDITWQDSGITAPAAAATADQVISVVNQALPHVHALSYYNLTAGVVYSSIRNRNFGFNTSNQPIQTGSSPIIDPVLFFTYYPWGLDAERPFQLSDLRPGLSIGISLTSPSTNFYIGGMSEIQRNVQLVYGFTVAKVSHLAPADTFSGAPSSASSTPATVQKFDKGGYIGLTFNFTGFVTSLLGGH